MSMEEEITKAINAHAAWKIRLKAAISGGKSEFAVATVQQDNQCEFGKWLYALQADVRASEHFKTVRQLHAEFHREAARILDLAAKRNTAEAETSMAADGRYTQFSSTLTLELKAWRDQLS